MPIPESQLETWAHQGSIAQSSATYQAVKRALEADDTAYATKSFKVSLQGSYANDTNIWAESDVDIVICLDSVFQYDVTRLSAAEKLSFHAAYSNGNYPYSDFRSHVIAALTKRFGGAVNPGTKAIKIRGEGNRRSADVIVANEFRRYHKFELPFGENKVVGISFFPSNGGRVVNYPEQHSANCTAKHAQTAEWFKPMVRVLKNLRGRLIENGAIDEATAPSYFLEGLLYNVPNDKFGKSYGDTFVAGLNWILDADRGKFVCANQQYYLLGDSPVQWSADSCDEFLRQAVTLWNTWSQSARSA